MRAIDFHTHRPPTAGDRLSSGIHPWNTPDITADDISRLRDALATNPSIVALGECGLDAMRGAPMPKQMELLRAQIVMSEELDKPLILHIVKGWDEIIRLKKELTPTLPWAIHGFRGKPALAMSLLQNGFYISLGSRYNPATAAIIPGDRLLIETDDAPEVAIETIAEGLPQYDPVTTLRFLGLDTNDTVKAICNISPRDL